MITVVAAPPFATIQDLGRYGYRDAGVPVSGVADVDTARALNALIGNDADAAMIEWAVSGGKLRFDSDTTIAIGGADANCLIEGQFVAPMTSVRLSAGAELHIERIVRGRFLYIAVRGGIDVPIVLGSRSTLLNAHIGGMDGRRLQNGDRLLIGAMIIGSVAHTSPTSHYDVSDIARIGILRGPQARLFDDAAWAAFLGTDVTVSHASDRVGYRLEGVVLLHGAGADFPSEPTCIGAIQVPNGGAPIVIMHDGPTVGGYPKIGVVGQSNLSRFAQLAPGDRVRFVDTTNQVESLQR